MAPLKEGAIFLIKRGGESGIAEVGASTQGAALPAPSRKAQLDAIARRMADGGDSQRAIDDYAGLTPREKAYLMTLPDFRVYLVSKLGDGCMGIASFNQSERRALDYLLSKAAAIGNGKPASGGGDEAIEVEAEA